MDASFKRRPHDVDDNDSDDCRWEDDYEDSERHFGRLGIPGLTHEFLSEIHGSTKFLQDLDMYSNIKGTYFINDGKLERKEKKRFELLSALARLLVQSSEVVALAPVEMKRDKVELVGSSSYEMSNELLVTSNQTRQNAFPISARPKKAKFENILETSKDWISIAENIEIDIGKDAIGFFLDSYQQQDFEQHARIVTKQLKALYGARLKLEDLQSRKESFDQAILDLDDLRNEFFNYIVISTISKIVLSFLTGITKYNFYFYLGLEPQFPEGFLEFEDLKVQERSPEMWSKELPTSRINFGGDLLDLEEKVLKVRLTSYDQGGRKLYDDLLRQCLRDAFQSAAQLEDHIQRYRKNPKGTEMMDEFRTDVRAAVKKTCVALHNLQILVSEDCLDEHLRWIEKRFDLKSTSDHPGKDPKKVHQTVGHFEKFTESMEIALETSLRELSVHTEAEIFERRKAEVSPGETLKRSRSQLKSSKARADPIDTQSEGQGWAGASRRWLKLVCATTECFRKLVSCEDSDIKSGLSNLCITIINASSAGMRPTCAPIEVILKDKLSATDDQDFVGDVVQFLECKAKESKTIHPPTKSAPMTGTLHCEAVLLSLHLFATAAKRDQIAFFSNHMGLEEGFIHKMKRMAPMIAVSKRSCPTCYIIIKVVERLSEVKYTFSGNHSMFFTCSIPRFLPQRYSLAVREEVKKEVFNRLTSVMDQDKFAGHAGLERQLRPTESPQSDAFTPSSSSAGANPVKKPRTEGLEDLVEEEAEKVGDINSAEEDATNDILI